MASGASTVSVVKAGYWIFGKDSIRPVGDIPSELFTHLYAGFAKVGDDGKLVIPDEYLKQFQDFTRTVRVRNSKVKTLLSIGGERVDLSVVVASSDKRKNLITSSIDLARKFGFDGLDLCWLYPSKTDDAANLEVLLKDWRNAVSEDAKNKPFPELLLTAEVSHHPAISRADNTGSFKYPDISKYLNWINVLPVDFYTPSNSPNKTGPVHAWLNPREQNKCGSEGIYNWINGIGPNPVKIDTQKLVLGLPFYGYHWTLKNRDQHDFFADANPPISPAARLAFRNIQADYININAGRLMNDHDMFVASYWHHEVTWIGFEDEHSIATKVKEAIRGNNLRGYFAWHLEADDYNWTLSNAASNAWDTAINNPGSTTTTTTTTHTGGTTTTTITTTSTAVSPEGEISKTVITNITTTDDAAAAAASGEGDTTTDDQNTSTRTSTTTTTTTTTTTSAATTTTTATAKATATSSSSLTICNIL